MPHIHYFWQYCRKDKIILRPCLGGVPSPGGLLFTNPNHAPSICWFLLAILLGISAAWGAEAAFAPGNLTIHFLDVGQGESILVQHGPKNVLIDGGEAEMGPVVSSYLTSQGVDSLDLVVATHPHSDHVGGLSSVLQRFPVGQVLDSGQSHTTSSYQRYLSWVDKKGIPFKVGMAGQTISLGQKARIDVLSPPREGYGQGLNEDSLVLRARLGGVSFLLMSDVGDFAEQRLLDSRRHLQSQVLKVGHHGSPYSSKPAFLSAVMPAASVITIGQDNDYGYPSPRVLRDLAAQGSAVYRTDLDGDIVITTDGQSCTVITNKQRSASQPPTGSPASPEEHPPHQITIWDLLMEILKYLLGGGGQ